MSYSAPFAYASKAIIPDPYAPVARPHHRIRRRRSRVRSVLSTAVSAVLSR